MNKVILKYKDGNITEIKTKLNNKDKIIKFLKITGDWSNDIVSLEIIENIKSVSCNYQNMEGETF